MEFLEKAFDFIMTKQIFGTAMVILVTFILITLINKGIEKIFELVLSRIRPLKSKPGVRILT